MIDSLNCGGAEKSLVSLLPLLDYNQIDVTLMLVGRGGIFERYVPKQVNIVEYNDGCRTWWQKLWLKVCRVAFSLLLRINMLKRKPWNSPTLEWMTCHTALRSYTDKHYDVAIAYQQGFPCYYVMDKVSADRKYAWINADLTKTKFRKGYAKPFYDKYDGVVTVSDILYDIILNYGLVEKNRLYCVYDIVNTDLIHAQAKEPVDTSIMPNDGMFGIVTTARLMLSCKGQDLCVKASRILANKGYDFRWIFVGDGPDRSKIEQLIEEEGQSGRIILAGMQPNPYPYMKVADVYVQSSRFEGFGLTITEAKLLGLPIVTTNFSSVYDQIEDGKNGLIVTMEASAIADAIERLMVDRKLRQALADANRQYENTTAKTEVAKVMKLIMS